MVTVSTQQREYDEAVADWKRVKKAVMDELDRIQGLIDAGELDPGAMMLVEFGCQELVDYLRGDNQD